MHVTDVNGDGRNDVITSNAHDYGIFWFEQSEGEKWTKRLMDDSWSQGHAVTLVDLNGDGKMDILTGKRFMAHNGKDPGEREPLGVYWYEQVTNAGKIEWVRHVIDYGGRTGGGMQIPVADLDGDGDLDFAVGGKSGLFLFVNKTQAVGIIELSLPYIRVHDRDNVAIILHPDGFTAREHIPQSNKIALKNFDPHEPVIRYGHVIGYAVDRDRRRLVDSAGDARYA